jgi:glycosyltransferase involved in cell wall biosynthesis
MIVKNESAIIERCLRSVLPHVDTFLILDTGSDDDTIEIIERLAAEHGVPGRVHMGGFQNFSQARNDALSLVDFNVGCDYILLMDADMELVVHDPDYRGLLAADAYSLVQRSGDLAYENIRLVHGHVDAHYVGVTHEHLDLAGKHAEQFPYLSFIDHANGSNRADKFARDAQLLMDDLERDPDNARSVFYLAQSFRDGGETAWARTAYARRAEMGGWDEEVWYSLYQVALLTEMLGENPVPAYLAAYNARPSRIEPLVHLARYHRERAMWPLAYMFAAEAYNTGKPNDSLFMEPSFYDWRSQDEYAIAAYWCGHYRASQWANEDLLREDKLPGNQRDRVKANLKFAQDALR